MTSESSRYANEDPLELEDYRPISVMAIVSLVASLFSFVVIFDLYLTFIPLIGIGLALLAKLQIRRGGGRYLGAFAANLAICICIFCISWSVMYRVSREYTIVYRARNCADEWLDKMRQGDIYELYALTEWYNERYRRTMNLELLYTTEPDEDVDILKRKAKLGMVDLSAKEEFEKYFEDELIDKLVKAGDQLDAKYVKPDYINYSDDVEQIGLIYNITTPDETIPVRIELDCLYMGQKRFWRIAGVSRADEARVEEEEEVEDFSDESYGES